MGGCKRICYDSDGSETYQGKETAYVYDLCGNRLKKLDKSGTEEYHYNRKNQLIGRLSEKDKTAYRYDQQGNLLEVAGAEERTVFSYKKSLYSPIPIKCAISLTEKASEKLDGVIELLGDIV